MRILLLAGRPNLESAGQKRRLSIKTAARAYPAATVRYFINSKTESIKKNDLPLDSISAPAPAGYGTQCVAACPRTSRAALKRWALHALKICCHLFQIHNIAFFVNLCSFMFFYRFMK